MQIFDATCAKSLLQDNLAIFFQDKRTAFNLVVNLV